MIVSRLRKIFAASGKDPKTALSTVSPGYRLTVADEDYDLARFRALAVAGRDLADAADFDEAATTLQRALQEWRGPVLEDLRGPRFIEDFAELLDEELLAAASARARTEIACGRSETVIASLLGLTRDHPFEEPLWAQLITALYLSGRAADALEEMERLKTLLADELGVAPSASIRDLERRIHEEQSLTVGTTSMTVTLLERSPGTQHGILCDPAGHTVEIPPAGLRIGRKPSNDLVLAGSNVSRHHAVVLDAGSRFEIRDLGSTNGTRVNGDLIVDRAILRPDDVIRIGDAEWTFRYAAGEHYAGRPAHGAPRSAGTYTLGDPAQPLRSSSPLHTGP